MNATFYDTVEPLRRTWADDCRDLLDEIADTAADHDLSELAHWDRLIPLWAMLDSGQRVDLKRHAQLRFLEPGVHDADRKLDAVLNLLDD